MVWANTQLKEYLIGTIWVGFMFKLSRRTDYGVILLCNLAELSNGQGQVSSAKNLAQITGLSYPMVAKLLKILAKSGVIQAKRGNLGGYQLVQEPKDLSLLKIIEVFEGKPFIADCLDEDSAKSNCRLSANCHQKNAWARVHIKIAKLLNSISLFELISSSKPHLLSVRGST